MNLNCSSYISLYTLPAVNQSIYFFEKYGLYIFPEYKNSEFKEHEYSRAEYVGIGRDYVVEWLEKKYLKIQKIWKIAEIWKFVIDFDEKNLTKIEITQWKSVDKEFLKEIVNQHIDAYSRYDDGRIRSQLEKERVYIRINPEEIIDIQENILYPRKSLVSFPLNVNHSKYISSQNLVEKIKINAHTFLDTKRNILITDEWEVMIGQNNKIYTKILELLAHSNTESITINQLQGEIPHLSTDNESLHNLEINFNKARFCRDFLDFKIRISSNGILSKEKK